MEDKYAEITITTATDVEDIVLCDNEIEFEKALKEAEKLFDDYGFPYSVKLFQKVTPLSQKKVEELYNLEIEKSEEFSKKHKLKRFLEMQIGIGSFGQNGLKI